MSGLVVYGDGGIIFHSPSRTLLGNLSGVGALLLLPNNGIVDELKDRRHDLCSCRLPPRRLPPSLLPGCDDVDADNIAAPRHDNDVDNPPSPPPS